MINEKLWDRFDKQKENIWKNFIAMEGIKVEYTVDEFIKEMEDKENLSRIKSILKSKISQITIGSKEQFNKDEYEEAIKNLNYSKISKMFGNDGVCNYFIINDIGYGGICDKCGTDGIVVLLNDKNYIENLDKKIWLPSLETYMSLKINPEDEEFFRNFPIAINPNTDFWYCPNCKELHKFNYDNQLGLTFDQEVLKGGKK